VSRLLLTAVVIALLAFVGAFVPIGGRTLVERWNAAPTAGEFADRGFREVSRAWDQLWGERPEGRSGTASARPSPARPTRATPPARRDGAGGPAPAEHHTDEDRSALDRIVAEHATDRASRR
jgi:hypothetical protein